MSLYGALNIGVAGLNANSQALERHLVQHRQRQHRRLQGRNRQLFDLPRQLRPGSATRSGGRHRRDRPGCHRPGPAHARPRRPPICRSRATASSWSRPTPAATGTQEYTRAGSFTPDASGNLVNAAGLYLHGLCSWTRRQYARRHQPAQPDQCHPTWRARRRPPPPCRLQANLESSATVDATYTAGDMTAGKVTPDFQTHHQCL